MVKLKKTVSALRSRLFGKSTKTKRAAKQNNDIAHLRAWLFDKPAKFSLLALGLTWGSWLLCIFTALVLGAKGIPPILIFTVITGLVMASLAFATYKLVKWLRTGNLDRYSFLAIDNGISLVSLIFIWSFILVLAIYPSAVFYVLTLDTISPTLFYIASVMVSLIYLYLMGMFISNVYAVSRRLITMGIPKWKVWASFPFSFLLLLWMPAYILTDRRQSKPVITIKARWFEKFINWIVVAPFRALLVFLTLTVLSWSIFDVYHLSAYVVSGLIFGIWLWRVGGTEKFYKIIGGRYANVSIILNIFGVIAFLFLLTTTVIDELKSNNIISTDTAEVIEITDTAKEE